MGDFFYRTAITGVFSEKALHFPFVHCKACCVHFSIQVKGYKLCGKAGGIFFCFVLDFTLLCFLEYPFAAKSYCQYSSRTECRDSRKNKLVSFLALRCTHNNQQNSQTHKSYVKCAEDFVPNRDFLVLLSSPGTKQLIWRFWVSIKWGFSVVHLVLWWSRATGTR